MHNALEFFIQANPFIVYALIFLGMLIEGEGIILFASIFAWQGLISWPMLGIVVIIGTICGDLLWYSAGKYLKNTAFGIWLDKRYEKTGHWVYEHIVSRYGRYALISKFMYFTTRPTIFLAGWHGFDFKKFFKATSIATIIWAFAMIIVGYFFGYTVYLIGYKKVLRKIELFAAGLFIMVFLIEYVLKRKFWKQPTSEIK